MRRILLTLSVASLLIVSAAYARERTQMSFHETTSSERSHERARERALDKDCDQDFSLGNASVEPPARWAPRRESRLARFTILSRDGKVALLLMPTSVAFQLSDGTMRKIENQLREEADEAEDNPIGDAIKTAVLAGVRVLLKHSAECSLRDLRDVDYRDGELVFISTDGERVFRGLDMNDDDLTRAFDEREARAFVHEFRRLRAVSVR